MVEGFALFLRGSRELEACLLDIEGGVGGHVLYVPYSRKVRVVPKMINIRGPAVTPGAKRAKSAIARSALRSGVAGMFSTVLVDEARSWNVTTTTSKRLGWQVSHEQRRGEVG
jgi:hypothetical protein